ncbi:MAG: hypothetical protein PHW79_08000 [Candidatus Marinimicrobia bacterium]|nr:hypothetical protein [Candidatus Neomarinimicrobiota bacterium]
MVKSKKIVILLMALTICFGQVKQDTATVDHFKTRKFNVVIFPASYYWKSEQKFTPTRQEVEKAEKALRKQLKALNKHLFHQEEPPIIHKNLKKYIRHYYGYIDQEGHRILEIHCFWEQSVQEYDWLEPLLVFDGGSHFWNVKYNLDTGVLFDLEVNGVA